MKKTNNLKIAVILIIAMVFIITPGLAVTKDNSTSIPDTILNPLVIEANPPEYAVYMSSVPGLDLRARWTGEMPGGNLSYEWNADSGQFLTWTDPDYEVKEQGNSTITESDSLYWTYWNTDSDYQKTDEPILITLNIKDATGELVGNASLGLEWKDDASIGPIPTGSITDQK